MRKIRDEQKGFIFIILIVIIILITSLIFFLSLKTNDVKEKIKQNQLIKVLFVIQDSDDSALFSNVMICNLESKKAGLINIPGYTGSIFRSLNRTDRIDMVYNENGISDYKKEVENLIGLGIDYTIEITLNDFIMLTDYLGGM